MGTAVETGAAGEEAVAVADLADVLLGCADSDERTGTAVFPEVDIFLGIERNNALAGGAAGGLDADAVGKGSGHQTVGIRFAEVILGEEGELPEVIAGLNVAGFETDGLHFVAVIVVIVPDVIDGVDETFVLPRADLLVGGGFNLFLIVCSHDI